MSDTTDRFALPLLHAGQAQKEMTHNEALAALDMLVHPVVEAVGIDDPPESPPPGAGWIVGPAPTGDWAGQAGALAVMTAGGWRFATLPPGAMAWLRDAGCWAHRDAGGWRSGRLPATAIAIDGVQVIGAQRAAIAAPVGGATVDSAARSAISAVLETLRGHGLIAS